VFVKGALSFAELGTFIPESGSEFIYIYKGFSSINPELGRVLAFVCIWSTAIISTPTGLAAISLACSQYALSSMFSKCAVAPVLVKLTAVLIMGMKNISEENKYKLRA
jgi:amino acid transporter